MAIRSCFSQGFYSCTNIMTKKQVGEERVYSASKAQPLPRCCSSPRKSGLEIKQFRKQELMQLLPVCSACSLIEPKTTSPKMVPPTRDLSPLITNWENALQLVGSHGGISLTEAPFSVITPAVSSWHKTSQYNWPLVNLTHKHITSKPQPLHSYSSPRSK